MATRARRTAAAAAPAKKEIVLTEENYENAAEGDYQHLKCCAFTEFSGLDQVKTVEDAVAIRRIASGDVPEGLDENERGDISFRNDADEYPDDYGTDGMVLVTTNSQQTNKHPTLKAAGFEQLAQFKRGSNNRNTTITLWGARTLLPGIAVEKGFKETVKI